MGPIGFFNTFSPISETICTPAIPVLIASSVGKCFHTLHADPAERTIATKINKNKCFFPLGFIKITSLTSPKEHLLTDLVW
jgi:hypothetical protein